MNQATRKCAQFTTLAAAVLLCAQAASAASIYAKIESTQQGVLKGDSPRAGLQDKTEVLEFSYSVNTPVGTAGQATGKRQHGPVRITKLLGPASPQLFQALVRNEVLKSVVIDFVGVNANGQEYLQSTIRLGSARVVAIEQSSKDPATGSAKFSSAAYAPTYEQISFVFSTIEITSHDGKTVAVDSLMAVEGQ